MADDKKYYYLKLKDNFFDSDAMILLEGMEDGYLYSNILLKLYLRSLKEEGKLMFNDRIPYNPNMIAKITRHSVGVIEKALNIFRELDLIEMLDNGAIYMLDIQNFIGRSSTEADRKREYRKRIESEKRQLSDNCPDKSPPEIEIEKEKELKIEIEKEKPSPQISYREVIDVYNNICVSLPKAVKISNPRRRLIKTRLKSYTLDDLKETFKLAEKSPFLKGENDRKWKANFDWLLNENNMVKVLEGNYNRNEDEPRKNTERPRTKSLNEQILDELKRQGKEV